jgi:hypothetical protein
LGFIFMAERILNSRSERVTEDYALPRCAGSDGQ